MAMSEAQTFGFSDDVHALYTKERAALIRAHIDADANAAELQALHAQALAANAAQEAAKRAQKAATAAFVALKHKLYVAASGKLDMAIAAVDKDSDAAANFRKLRSDVERGPRASPADPAQPLPVPRPAQ